MTVTRLQGGWISILDENLEQPHLSEKHLFRVEDVVRVSYDGGYALTLPDGTRADSPPTTVVHFRTSLQALTTSASYEDVYAAVRADFLPSR